jgi:L-amino acid N-acyltransferase YncA
MLSFRLLEPKDQQDIAAWASDEEAEKWLSGIGSNDWFNHLQDDPKTLVLMALVRDKAVGMVQAEFLEDGSAALALLIDPQMRSQRYGRMILKQALGQPELEAAKSFCAYVDPGNEASLKCFLIAGFQKAGAPDENGLLKLTSQKA